VAIALSAEALLGEGRRPQETVLVDAAVMQRFKLKVGSELDADTGEQLLASATALGTYDAATAALALRGRSRRELERWLKQRKHAAPDIRSALERLDDLGFLDDESYARSYARAKMAGGKTSRRRIAMELARRGVARDLVDRVIREAGEEEGFDEQGALEAAAERRARSLSKMEPEVARRRLMGFLLRRGFGGEEVRKVIQATFPR
jgi:regulatory protein